MPVSIRNYFKYTNFLNYASARIFSKVKKSRFPHPPNLGVKIKVLSQGMYTHSCSHSIKCLKFKL